DSSPARFSPTTCGTTPSFRTFDCERVGFGSSTPRSKRECTRLWRRSMSKSIRLPRLLAPDASFDEVVVPHLDAAFRLARCLTRNEHDAEDVVQEASLRAFRYFRTFTGGDGRAWFLRIVRNTC